MKQFLKYWALTILTVTLTIVFAVLKLSGIITWSWWWIFSPIFIPYIISGIIVVISLGVMAFYSKRTKK